MNITTYRTNWMLRSAVGIALVFAGAGLCSADGFFDDFEDGSVTNDIPLSDDGIPVKWTPRLDRPGDYDVLDGDYVFTPVPESGEFLSSSMLEVDFENTSIRSRVRMSEIDYSVGISVRNQDADDDQLYFGGILANANNDPILFLGRSDAGGGRTFFEAGVEILPSFDLSKDDAMLQLDIIGDELKLWGWRAGDPMPDEPQITHIDPTYASGFVSIFNNASDGNAGTFRFVQVADTHIPEPSTAILSCLGFLSLLAWRLSTRQ